MLDGFNVNVKRPLSIVKFKTAVVCPTQFYLESLLEEVVQEQPLGLKIFDETLNN